MNKTNELRFNKYTGWNKKTDEWLCNAIREGDKNDVNVASDLLYKRYNQKIRMNKLS